jgi:hypothetical protein
MSLIRTNILKAIDRFLADSGMSAHAFGVTVLGDHKFYPRLRNPACNVTLFRIEAVEAFIGAERAHLDGAEGDAKAA